LRNSAKNKTLWKLGKGRDVFFFELFFGARGVGGEGEGSELLGGWGCCQVVFSSLFFLLLLLRLTLELQELARSFGLRI
jgi:hypothetical protein